MDTRSEDNVPQTPPPSEARIITLIKEMQQQLIALEQKIDDLVQQSSERSYQQQKPFSKPFRSYEGSRGPRERDFPSGRRFDRSRDEGQSGGNFIPYRSDRSQGEGRHDSGPREGNFPPGRRFDRPRRGGPRGFGPRRKKF